MAPNWFIAFPVQVQRLHLPPPPPRVRVFAETDLHITLGFLGPVEESSARKAWDVVGRYDSFRPVVGSFSGVRSLGNRRKSSAISAIVADGAQALSEMIGASRVPVLAAADARPDERPPLPHMTVARIQRRANVAERRSAMRWAAALDLAAASFVVSSVALYTWASNREQRLFDIVELRQF